MTIQVTADVLEKIIYPSIQRILREYCVIQTRRDILPLFDSQRDLCTFLIVLISGRWVASVSLPFCPTEPELSGEGFDTPVSR